MSKFTEKIISVFFKDEGDAKLGDFLELYNLHKDRDGLLKSFFWLWVQILSSIPKLMDNKIYWGVEMFINYLKITIRNIIRNKLYSFINLSGLSVGLGCCLLIFMWCSHEISFDQFHNDIEDSFIIYEDVSYSNGTSFQHMSTPGPLVGVLKERYPEIKYATHVHYYYNVPTSYEDKAINQDGIIFVDNDFFSIYNFKLIEGDKESLLVDPYSVVLTKNAASRYFGELNPIGKVLKFDNKHEVKVTGVLENLPDNTVYDFEMLLPFSNTKVLIDQDYNNWRNDSPAVTITLKQGSNPNLFENKITNLISEFSDRKFTKLKLKPLKDIYLYTLNGENRNITNVYIFGAVGVFVLLIACINFMNLSTARSVKRSKEIGLRKVIGVRKKQLINQFLGESIFSAFLAMLLGLVFLYFVLPVFNNITGKQIEFAEFFDLNIFSSLIFLTLFTGLVSGIYPAFYLSSFDPKIILSGTFTSGKKSVKFRKILTVVQFSISIVLIISTIVVSNQLNYLKNVDLGYQKNKLLLVQMPGDTKEKYEAIRNGLLNNKNIIDVTRSNRKMNSTSNSTTGFVWEGKDPDTRIRMNFALVDYHFFNTMGIKIIEGDNFTNKYRELSSENNEYILNETALRRTGLKNPIGKVFNWGDKRKGIIKGIVSDFHFSSLKQEIRPLVLMQHKSAMPYLFIKFSNNNFTELVDNVKSVWDRIIPETPIQYSFVDDNLNKLYKSEFQIRKLFNGFSILALFIACLGLVGMASYTVEQRIKEMSIRRVLGASLTSLLAKQTTGFLKLIIYANIIAGPVAYYFMTNWLTDFAYRITLGIDFFLIAAGIAIIVSLVTISFQLLKASFKNPVDTLRTE